MLLFLVTAVISNTEQKCYVSYSDRFCPRCYPRENTNCGFCINLNQCDVGDENGPFNLNCLPGYWIPQKNTCTNNMCLLAKEKVYCRFPCIWRTDKCILSRDVSEVTDKEKYNASFSTITKQFFFYSLLIFAAFCIIFLIYSIYYNRRPLYTSLPNLENGVSLDDLPPMMDQFN